MAAEPAGAAATAANLASSGDNMTPSETALYIAELASQLAALASSARLDTIAYFLDMVRTEAASTARRLDSGQP